MRFCIRILSLRSHIFIPCDSWRTVYYPLCWVQNPDNLHSLLRDSPRMNYYNSKIVERHDDIMHLNEQWNQFLNFLLTLHFWDDCDNKMIHDEILATRCYDV